MCPWRPATRTGLDRLEGVKAGLEIRSGSAPTPECRIERLVLLPVRRMVVPTGRVSLPELEAGRRGVGAPMPW